MIAILWIVSSLGLILLFALITQWGLKLGFCVLKFSPAETICVFFWRTYINYISLLVLGLEQLFFFAHRLAWVKFDILDKPIESKFQILKPFSNLRCNISFLYIINFILRINTSFFYSFWQFSNYSKNVLRTQKRMLRVIVKADFKIPQLFKCSFFKCLQNHFSKVCVGFTSQIIVIVVENQNKLTHCFSCI